MKKLFSFILAMTICGSLSAQSLMFADFEGKGTDNWCENRITEESDGAKIDIVSNPKTSERNNSDKVLKIYEVRKGGMIDFNLAAYWTGSSTPLPEKDKILLAETDGTPIYTRLRLKYYIEGAGVTSSKLDGIKIQLLENQEKSAKNIKSWTYPFETQNGTWNDWNEVTFEFEVDGKSDRILLFSYIDWTTTPIDGVTIYIDDVEFFKPEIPLADPSLMIGNFEGDGTDKWVSNRAVKDYDACTTLFEIVNNPMKETGVNESNKVLKIYNINYKGQMGINLTRNIANSSDHIDQSPYTGLRMKYYVSNPTFADLDMILKPNGAEPRVSGTWKNKDKNWKTVEFPLTQGSQPSWLQLFPYYGNSVAYSADVIQGLEIYIDDIELFYPAGLNNIKVDGQRIAFFDPDKLAYNYYLPYSHTSTNIPVVTYETAVANQTVQVIPATNLSGSEAERTTVLEVLTDGDKTGEYKILFSILPQMDIYLCMGQSNMSGYGYITQEDEGFIENTYLFSSKLVFEEATNPLNQYSVPGNSPSRISPAYGFAKALIGKADKPIGLVVNAINGSAIEAWLKGSSDTRNMYTNTLARVKEAQKWGEIKGILWHQGCSNSGDPTGYKPKLTQLATDFRTDLNDNNIFFVAGELPYWRGNGTASTAFNQMIRTISTFVDNSDWVSADGLTYFVDTSDPHFNRESAITLGERYAEKMIQKFYSSNSLSEDKAENVNYIINGRELSVYGIADNTTFSIIDIFGRSIFNTNVNSGTVGYTFPESGIYFFVLNNDEGSICRKILLK